MVQLSTRYDTALKKKVFILKGEEAYARTTDVLADVVSDFADCNTHLGSARVGLVIDVLREIGDGWVYIYDNDDLIFEPIPWNSAHMDTIIDSDWNDKGVYWNDGKLEIGTSSDNNTGFRLAYDIEHNIVVKYSGNKQCLASSSDTINFVMPTPELFKSTLTLTSGTTNQRYDTGDTIDDISLLYQSTSSSNNKQVRVYLDGELSTTVTLTTGTASTLNFGVLSDGLHSIRAVFDGDEYSTYAETSLDISVGYQVRAFDYPSAVIYGSTHNINASVHTYKNAPVKSAYLRVVEYNDGEYVPVTDSRTTSSNGTATFNNVEFTGSPMFIRMNSTSPYYYSDEIEYTIVDVTSITLNTSPYSLVSDTAYITKGNTLRISGYCNDSNGKVSRKGIPVTLTYGNHTETTSTDNDGLFRFDYVGTGAGYVPMTVTVGSKSKTIVVEDLIQYWKSKQTNPQDMVYTPIYAEITQLNNGYRLTPTSLTNGISFTNFSQYGKVELEFDVISLNGGKLHVNYQSFDITQGHVTATMDFDNEWLEVFVDGDNVKSLSSPYTVILFGITGNSLIFNNLKLKKWVDSNE